MTDPTPIHEASSATPILARQEPGFRRVYAQGSLIHHEKTDPEVVRIAFWSEKTENLELEEGVKGTGYSLETEVVMTWSAAERLHVLIGKWLQEHRPQRSPKTSPNGD